MKLAFAADVYQTHTRRKRSGKPRKHERDHPDANLTQSALAPKGTVKNLAIGVKDIASHKRKEQAKKSNGNKNQPNVTGQHR